ncbi:glycosyltransferase family 61 protein [Geomonas sp. RF6]|uniref:glycosyltransferase family 61 protein n=1 Tax=Geomonas sp. RF6 TaxID=2897342 RepID=UPI001E639A3D|nr:glycosyltransferase 61 family protein [Geomonas sp. RF6]UFS69299.1 glycosyltransferase family 61 protein [Geomonas sp. RF6]
MAKRRRKLVRLVSRALLGPIVGKMPKSSIESLEKLSYLPKIERHIQDIIPVADAQIVRHEIDAPFPPFLRTEAAFGKRNLYVLNDAVVSPHSGMVWIEKRIVEESVGSLRRIMDWGDILHEPLLPVRKLHVREPVVVCHPASYYHWLLEVLPNLLFAISRFPDVKIVVPEKVPGYIAEGLATALGANASDRFITCPSPVRVATLVMPQYHTVPEFTHPDVMDLLKSEVKSKVMGEGGTNVARHPDVGENLYVSRRRSRRRRLAGEDLLEGKLRDLGFTVLHCEELSFAEQVHAFHRAKTVVATHGAGLSNLVWSEAPCRVVEIFPKNYILDCFSWLSFSLGFDYRYVICSTGHKLDQQAIAAVLQQI